MLYRHGDVLLQAVPELPEGGERVAEPVLAYGEVTGHSHRVADPAKVELWRVKGELYLRVLDATRVIHEEHAPIELAPGTYHVWRQREYVPARQRRAGVSFRTVRD